MLLPVVVRLRTTSFTRCWKLSDTDSAKLGGVLTQCPALDHLEIVGIRFDNDRTNTSVFDVVARGLTQCASLTHLRFRDMMMTAGAADCLGGVLGHCPALTHLDLSLFAVGALVARDVVTS